MRNSALFALVSLQFYVHNAYALSLNNFQAAPDGVSVVCGLAYGSTINGCSTSDFSNGNACSSDCQSGLTSLQHTLLLLCAASSKVVPSNSLLAAVLTGNTVVTLCAEPKSASSSSPLKTSTKTTTTPIPTSKTVQQPTTLSFVTKESTTSKPTSTRTATSTGVDSSTPSSEAPSSSPSLQSSLTSSSSATATDLLTDIGATITLSSTAGASSATSTNVPSTGQPDTKKLTVQEQQILAISHSGGGSPFDIVISSDATQSVTTFLPFVVVVALGAILGG